MSITHVTSPSNATLKRLRSLKEKKYRRAEGLFLAEGLRILTEAADQGWTPAILLVAEGRLDHPLVRRLVRATLAEGGQVLEVPPALLSTVTGKDNPQSVAAAYRTRATDLAALPCRGIVLAAERLRDPGNLGTLLRAADAAGASALVLVDDSADPTSVEAVRASMGAFFTVPTAQAAGGQFLEWRRGHGARLVGAALDARAVDYRDTSWASPCIILLGNEAQGLPEPLKAACDALVRIPMHGRADSLNVAMAGTLLLYEAVRAGQTR